MRLALAGELVPAATRVAVVVNPVNAAITGLGANGPNQT